MKPDTQWFTDAKFGMFVHWGVYALAPGDEWAIYRKRIPKDVYRQYQARFRPDRFDPDAWVAMAKQAGMTYLVFTSKHHDGFCMYDSQLTDWKVTNTPYGRDVLKEVADACRRGGLRFGIYFSIWDLMHPGLDGGLGDIGADGELVGGNKEGWTPSKEGIEYMHGQVEELLSNYGDIDVFWFDVKRAGGEAYEAERLMKRMRELQPNMLINERLVSGSSDLEDLADIKCPENRIPEQGLVDEDGNPQLWEACMCYNEHWGYVRDDTAYKGPARVIQELVEIVSKGGNLLLNVGPDPRGLLPGPWYPEMYEQVGRWVDLHQEAIFGAEPCRITSNGDVQWNRFFYDNFRWKVGYTRKGNLLYAHALRYPQDRKFIVPKLDGYTIDYMYLLDDGYEVQFEPGSYLSLNPTETTVILPENRQLGVTTVVMELREV